MKPCTRPALHRQRRHAVEALRSGASIPTSGTAERRGGRPGRGLPCMHGRLAHCRPFPQSTPLRRPSTASGCAHQRGVTQAQGGATRVRRRLQRFGCRAHCSKSESTAVRISRCIKRLSAASALRMRLDAPCRHADPLLFGPVGRESHDTGPRVSFHGTSAQTPLRLHPGRALPLESGSALAEPRAPETLAISDI